MTNGAILLARGEGTHYSALAKTSQSEEGGKKGEKGGKGWLQKVGSCSEVQRHTRDRLFARGHRGPRRDA